MNAVDTKPDIRKNIIYVKKGRKYKQMDAKACTQKIIKL